MPREWTLTRLGDHISLKGGLSYKGEFVNNGDALLVGMGCVSHTERFLAKGGKRYSGEFSESNRVRPGDLVIATRQQSDNLPILGFPAMIPDYLKGRDVIVATNLYKVTNDSDISNRFLYWLLRGKDYRERILGCAKGTTVRMMTKDAIEDFQFLCPPVEERNAIASALDLLDDKIELNRRMNATLEAMARALFQSWFVDPVQKCLPNGWRYAKISDLCAINAWTLNKCDKLERIEYVEISEVTRGNIANIQVFQRGEEPSRARRRLQHGDTVLSTVRPERGSYFLCLNPSPNFIASTGFAVVTPTKALWSFVHAALTNPELSDHLGQQADGGAYPAVRPEIIGKWEVPWPEKLEIVEQFHHICAPLYERADNNRRESRTLATLRDALLPKLLSGKVRLNEPTP